MHVELFEKGNKKCAHRVTKYQEMKCPTGILETSIGLTQTPNPLTVTLTVINLPYPDTEVYIHDGITKEKGSATRPYGPFHNTPLIFVI